ncbi:hypothetical protein LEP1GSC008_3250 [Leptospira kirschneri serovar Bulgarica str. Nikolaevo]|uniref:Uncharacterized protein n=1 Tax=Leptospira kirschneri serovar Bulgarica str. Nikolaevo TaxID=1240687 RepID=M6FI82_9LEPT|nr:hypothetical protein LEP1GSC008_3250 [Leptospira kirschneri serovar Bulgarica str. Nikolaevo]
MFIQIKNVKTIHLTRNRFTDSYKIKYHKLETDGEFIFQ